jgi:hypothetical protein
MQIGMVAKKIWAQRRRDSFLRAQRLTTASAESAGRFPPIWRHRRRNRCLCSSCAGVGIHTQRDSRPAETARESLAALCTGTAAPPRKARRCAAEIQGPSEANARAAIAAHCPILRENPDKPESEQ